VYVGICVCVRRHMLVPVCRDMVVFVWSALPYRYSFLCTLRTHPYIPCMLLTRVCRGMKPVGCEALFLTRGLPPRISIYTRVDMQTKMNTHTCEHVILVINVSIASARLVQFYLPRC
jgi:hypothetical protein